ncbi:Potassium-transporting ATPase C chain [Arcticibacter svalbardensis MN12-7]|uniref:Potassium-transporting ATPase KdpC subunit n=1 Tax=Arcticibacter svalbardensis MN12-7 TaxID=1150600 RepID=R9GXC9_9SPHI|nr:K(+)-transporting ATPase subunit C [Arcticibacter svalbardensis]EOR96472.1 Potassium-transporting ATPase C chain [Arcticibacter svalbardensis MN12-7]
MKKYIFQSIRLTLVLLVLLGVIYPLIIAFAGRFAKGEGNGEAVLLNGKKVGYANIGQSFTEPQYFWGRPSAANYNAAGSAGSNKGPSNVDYLKDVENRIDTLLKYNPGLKRSDIPADLVTASGSGLDPDISVQAAIIQIKRVANVRNLSLEQVQQVVKNATTPPLLGLLGPEKVNVLQLNLSLDRLSK